MPNPCLCTEICLYTCKYLCTELCLHLISVLRYAYTPVSISVLRYAQTLTVLRYAQVYREPFWVDVVQQREEKRLRRMGIVCFNCGEDHHLKDCPEVREGGRRMGGRDHGRRGGRVKGDCTLFLSLSLSPFILSYLVYTSLTSSLSHSTHSPRTPPAYRPDDKNTWHPWALQEQTKG